MRRFRADTAILLVTLALVAAFLVSFVTGLRLNGASRLEPALPTADVPPAPRAVRGRVEVLNAGGRTGMARLATERLRDAGFDVVYYGNAPAWAGDTSVVLVRRGDDAVARAAAEVMAIPRVRTEPDSSLLLDATVIVGSDWPTPAPPSAAPADPRDN